AVADELDDARKLPSHPRGVDSVVGDVLREIEFPGAELEHRGEGPLEEKVSGLDFAEEEKELRIHRVRALEDAASAVEQLGVGEVGESRVHTETGTTHFFGGRKGRCRARTRHAERLERVRAGSRTYAAMRTCARHPRSAATERA